MCGIFGYFSKSEVKLEALLAAARLQEHRGPDDIGIAISNDTHFKNHSLNQSQEEIKNLYPMANEAELVKNLMLHQRLSILDLSYLGHQPMKKDGITFIFNGEIYNYIEIRSELESLGHKFITTGDSEVVLCALNVWGKEAFKKFNGMWAIVYHDESSNELIMSRDRYGIKPLYYSLNNDKLIFSSEIKPIKCLLDTVTVNQEELGLFINDSILESGEHTLINEIKIVPEGMILSVSLNDLSIQKKSYYNLASEGSYGSIGEVLDRSIDLRLRADVPVGMLISGGLDSSILAGIITKDKDIELNAYSSDYKEKRFSEKEYVDSSINYLDKLKVNYVYPEVSNFEEMISELISVQEVPFRSLSVLNQNLLYQEIKKDKNLKVIINGQGSDEIFGGYTNHYFYRLFDYLFKFKLSSFLSLVKFLKKERKMTSKSIVLSLANTFTLATGLKDIFKTKTGYARKSFKKKLGLKGILKSNLRDTFLKELLHYEDRNSMKNSVESRLPFLDYRLVESAFALDDEALVTNTGDNKKILRDYARGRVTDTIIDRKDKMGFVSPQEVWQETILKDTIKNELENLDSRLKINPDLIGKYKNNRFRKKNATLYWRIFITSRWLKEFIGQ